MRDWYPLRRWVDVSDGERGVTLAPLDAPLAQLGGITTGRAAYALEPDGPAVYSWALNNHWSVNFRAFQEGEIPLRYRLTTHAGACDDAAAARFAAEAATPPLVLRDWIRRGAPDGQFLALDDDGVELTAKPAEDGDGIVVRLHDQRGAEREVALRFATAPSSAAVVSPLELDERAAAAGRRGRPGPARRPRARLGARAVQRRRSGMRRTILSVVAAAALAWPAAASADACRLDPSTPAKARPATALNAMFAAYGDSNRRLDDWTGADNTASVALPDGRTAWVFADTFLDRVNADHSRDNEDFIQNSIVVQRGDRLVRTVHGGTRRHPETLIQTDDGHQSDGKEEVGDSWYWANGATVDGGKLQVFVNKYWMFSDEVFGFEWLGNAIATFSLPGLRLESVRQIVSADGVTWGSTVVREGGYQYVYGNKDHAEDPTKPNELMLARAKDGDLLGRWEYWNGSGWSIHFRDAAPLLEGNGTAVGIQKVGGAYVLVTFDNRSLLSPDIVAYSSCSLTGPWSGPTKLYQTPETGGNQFTYDARLHPQLSRNGRLVLSYNVNSFEFQDLMDDVRIYRPRFVSVKLPPLVP